MMRSNIKCYAKKAIVLAVTACMYAGTAQAIHLDTSPDWVVNFDNSVQYTMGWRAQSQDPNIANQLFMQQGDARFPKKGDMVTNRIQDLIELQGVYQGTMGYRVSGSYWKDFAYNDNAPNNTNPAFAGLNTYPSGQYSDYTKKYFVQGGDLLDAFVFSNTQINETPVYVKAGRLSEYWGNAFFFGFSNIAYSQSPVDYIKGFTQPGSEVKELFLPRRQIVLSTDISPELSVTGEYFLEFEPNRYPEAGTYLGFFDVLFDGPPGGGALAGYGITHFDGEVQPANSNHNFGLKANWSPSWAHADIGFYYRKLDEVHPWLALVNPATGHLQETFAQGVSLVGLSLEKSFGEVSMGFELNQRRHTAINTAGLSPTNVGATGAITNFIGNTFIQLGTTPLWDSGILLAEFSYTHLNGVDNNAQAKYYNGVGTANCHANGTAAAGSWRDGCATENALALAFLFDPQWLQRYPGIDIDMPMSFTWGASGNPAYQAGSFYAQDTKIYSIGIKGTFHANTSLELQYNGYFWRPGAAADNGLGKGLNAYAGFGGNGAVSLNDRGWVQLTLKSSF